MNVAYVGSCYSEEFLKHVLNDVAPSLRFYRINSVSLMDEKPFELGDISELRADTQRHLSYENRRNFRDQMRQSKPDLLVVDFIRDIRCALLTDGEAYLSFPYELIAEEYRRKTPYLERLEIIPFATPEYVRLHRQALDRFCAFLNEELPDTQVLILNFMPTWDYRGRLRTTREFRSDFMAWSARAPMQDLMGRYCVSLLNAGKLLSYDGPLWSDDLAKYGPASVHYAPACWRLMAQRFQINSLAFSLAEPPSAAELGGRLRASFDAFGEEGEASGAHWRGMERSGADVLTDLMPALLHEMEYRHGMNRRPNVVDAYQAFYWLLGRGPESMETLLAHSAESSLQSLRRRLLRSEEFQARMRSWMEDEAGPQ
ncbi:DUF6270 domain-containing protein [Sphingobium sp. CAP-1]|uniref:DUF6270 domain-containing protein n=1 Tax=Sphingobium sp. CAP-1 TaxID=2676077 RepID=UPI0012BB2671|nr:DUF6270 domain-containing protein [Sphingobium sp. CAP-1]QGP78167.1 hypothetical protein GL174_03520 [Sphingobium sp. CAP-1]